MTFNIEEFITNIYKRFNYVSIIIDKLGSVTSSFKKIKRIDLNLS